MSRKSEYLEWTRRKSKVRGWITGKDIVPTYSWEKELGISRWINKTVQLQSFSDGEDKPKETRCEGIRHTVHDYCTNTSLHGFKYITGDNFILVERIFWIVSCALALVSCVYFLQPVVYRYIEGAIQTSVASTNEPIWNVPFPGVTICNTNKVSQKLLRRAARREPWKTYGYNVTATIASLMATYNQLEITRRTKIDEKYLQAIHNEGQKVDQLMQDVMQPINKMAVRCWWLGRVVSNCSKLFSLRRTDEGYCWGFNTVEMRTELPDYRPEHDHGIEDDDDIAGNETRKKRQTANSGTAGGTIQTHHSLDSLNVEGSDDFRRVNGAGPIMGLSIMLNPDTDDYFETTNEVYGFKVVIHNSEDFPLVSRKGFLASAGREVHAAVTPIRTDSSPHVKEIYKSNRKCIYPEEYTLDFYPMYSLTNCVVECAIHTMRHICKCLPYLYNQLNNSRLCDYDGIMCLQNKSRTFLSIKPHEDIEGIDHADESMHSCQHCKPNCEDTAYVTEVTAAKFPAFVKDITLPSTNQNVIKAHLVLLRIFFKDMTFIRYRRDLAYTLNDVLESDEMPWLFSASIGGIAGLFIGFSFISSVEVLYFLTLRPVLRRSGLCQAKKCRSVCPFKK